MRWCRHHRSPSPMEHTCLLGHNPEAGEQDRGKGRPPGGHYRLPCHDATANNCGIKRRCHDYSPLTDDEIQELDRQIDEDIEQAVRRMNAVAPLVARIKREHRDSASGSEACPACGQNLMWSISGYNHHVRMRCSGDDCINFIE